MKTIQDHLLYTWMFKFVIIELSLYPGKRSLFRLGIIFKFYCITII